ncbi:hypothetical protein Bxe_B1340 [Paraburkholderia xenovorans LB400]|uniref:Uncharacterized protein n=1 Tax=Paraburkholderia xenovorans (strain LB400) TaxID=266265 RepID=Q13MR7_PARXL|nr:hypothetical protein Bxe_B1340 [Paraburkholderia xenovorans LB400]
MLRCSILLRCTAAIFAFSLSVSVAAWWIARHHAFTAVMSFSASFVACTPRAAAIPDPAHGEAAPPPARKDDTLLCRGFARRKVPGICDCAASRSRRLRFG